MNNDFAFFKSKRNHDGYKDTPTTTSKNTSATEGQYLGQLEGQPPQLPILHLAGQIAPCDSQVAFN